MKPFHLLLPFLILLLPASLRAQALSATATTIAATCPSNGAITVTATNGTPPYRYSLTGGPATRTEQTSNIFANLPPGVFTVTVKDNTGATFILQNVTVADQYNDMVPTATPTNEICRGSNTGAITLAMPTGQGTPPYTYTIQSGPTTQPPAVSSAASYTFTNLAPGFYDVRVTDACGAFQSRQATLAAGSAYTLNVSVYARPNACDGTMDYYVSPSYSGTGPIAPPPYTFYAYRPDGTLAGTLSTVGQTPIPLPGGGASSVYKFTLPYPAVFPGMYYTFRRTDMCVTNPMDARVTPVTPRMGDISVTTAYANCQPNVTGSIGEGFNVPVTVTLTPTGGGTPITQQIGAEGTPRNTTFSAVPPGSYTVSFVDECGKTVTRAAYTVASPTANATLTQNCITHIPGTAGLEIGSLTGWQYPITLTITSGPTSFYSAPMDKTYTNTYPKTLQVTNISTRYLVNLSPGDYTFELSDGCSVKTITKTVTSSPVASYTVPPETVTGCAGSRVLNTFASSPCGYVFLADVRKQDGSLYKGSNPATFSYSNIPNGTYYIEYYSNMPPTYLQVFTVPVEDKTTQGSGYLVKRDTVVVANPPTNPHVSGVNTASCGDGTVSLKLIPEQAAADIIGYAIKNPDGSWSANQASPIFTVSGYGTYDFRIEDACGNSGVTSVSVKANPVPEIQSKGNKCLGGDITLFTQVPDGATAEWTKPDGTKVQGAQLTIPNASESDKGAYTLSFKYTAGECKETTATTVTLGDCIPLPVNWGTFSAAVKGDSLVVQWSTLKEINNSHFEIEVSADGKNWEKIGEVESASRDGNSDTELNYSFGYKYADAVSLFGVSVLLAMMGFATMRKRKYRVLLFIGALVSIVLVIHGCKRRADELLNDKNQKLFVRIIQVDKDGGRKATKVIQAVRE